MDIVSVQVVSPAKLLQLKQAANSTLMEDMNLDKAADLSAQLKQLNRKIIYWTKRVRQPFGDAGTPGRPEADVDTDAGPTQAMVTALIKTIKNPATPTQATVATPRNSLNVDRGII